MLKIVKKILRKLYNTYRALINILSFLYFDLSKIKKAKHLFVLPVYHTGGAERVHLNIIKGLERDGIVILFTDYSVTNNFFDSFKMYADIVEIHKILRQKNQIINKLLFRLLISAINKNKELSTVFGCNSVYFYRLLPAIKEEITKIDLFHAFVQNDSRTEDVVKSSNFIDHRVVINRKAFDDLIEIYTKAKVEKKAERKIKIIENAIDYADSVLIPKNTKEIKIGYLGRWGDEKRLDIFLGIAKKIMHKHKNVSFVMAGTGMKSNLRKIEDAGVQFLGEISNDVEICNLYNKLNFILITSDNEGFPMILVESMFFGVVPIVTNVGGIQEHIFNLKNGVLIENSSDIDLLINKFSSEIDFLINDSVKFKELSRNAAEYARLNFKIDKFNSSYRNLFLSKY